MQDPITHRNFVRDYLGPILKREHPNIKLMVLDDDKVRTVS